MNSFIIVFAAALAVAHGGLLAPLARTTVLEGPSTSAHIIGNDGSQIVGVAPGGRIIANENLGSASLAYSAPVAPIAHAAPLLAPAPVLARASPLLAPAPVLARAAPLLAPAPVLAHASPLLLAGDRSIISLPRGQGIEGAWIPDYNEKFFDDGSYKGEIY